MIRGPDFLSREANNGAISKILFQKLLQSNESMRVLPRQEKGGIPGANTVVEGLRHTFCVTSIGQMQLTLYVVTVSP